MTQRLSVNINDETAAALDELARKRQTTVTEIVRRAISVYKFIEDETESGKRLQLVDADDHAITLQIV
jgi:predicted transcriptional regulator